MTTDANGIRHLLADRYSSPEWFLTFEVPIHEGDEGLLDDIDEAIAGKKDDRRPKP